MKQLNNAFLKCEELTRTYGLSLAKVLNDLDALTAVYGPQEALERLEEYYNDNYDKAENI